MVEHLNRVSCRQRPGVVINISCDAWGQLTHAADWQLTDRQTLCMITTEYWRGAPHALCLCGRVLKMTDRQKCRTWNC